MDRWKSRGGKSQGGEDKKWEDQRRERERRKKMQVREKVGKSRFTAFFQWFAVSEGRKWCGAIWPDEGWKVARCSGAKHISKSKCTKHTILSPLLEVEMSKKCTLLWCEAHFQVKMFKAPHVRTIFGSSEVEKVHAIVARSIFPGQRCKKLWLLSRFWRSDVEKVHTD